MSTTPDRRPFSRTPDYLADGWPILVIEGMVLAGLMNPGLNTTWPELLLTPDMFTSKIHRAIISAFQQDWEAHGRVNRVRVVGQLTALEANRLKFWQQAGIKLKLMLPVLPLAGLCTTLHQARDRSLTMNTAQRAEKQAIKKTLKAHEQKQPKQNQHDSVSPDAKGAIFMAGWA